MYGTLFVYAGPTGVGKTQDAASCFLDFSVVSLSAIHREAYGSPVVESRHKDAVTRRAFKRFAGTRFGTQNTTRQPTAVTECELLPATSQATSHEPG